MEYKGEASICGDLGTVNPSSVRMILEVLSNSMILFSSVVLLSDAVISNKG